jgi:hypothetical protein
MDVLFGLLRLGLQFIRFLLFAQLLLESLSHLRCATQCLLDISDCDLLNVAAAESTHCGGVLLRRGIVVALTETLHELKGVGFDPVTDVTYKVLGSPEGAVGVCGQLLGVEVGSWTAAVLERDEVQLVVESEAVRHQTAKLFLTWLASCQLGVGGQQLQQFLHAALETVGTVGVDGTGVLLFGLSTIFHI